MIRTRYNDMMRRGEQVRDAVSYSSSVANAVQRSVEIE